MIEDYFLSTFKSPNRQTQNKLSKTKLQSNIKYAHGNIKQKTFFNIDKNQLKYVNQNNQKSESAQISNSHSKITRTQNSKDKLNKIQQLKRQQMKFKKLKNKYLKQDTQSNQFNKRLQNNQKKHKKNLKTQNSKQKYYKNQKNNQGPFNNRSNDNMVRKTINNSSNQQQQYYVTNNYRQNDYTQTQNNNTQSYDTNIKESFHDQSLSTNQNNKFNQKNQIKMKTSKNTPMQINDSNPKYCERDSQSNQQDSRQFNINNISSGRQSYLRNGQIIQNSNQEDQATVTKSVGNNRYSSLSVNKKIKKKKFLTYYQCEIKQLYNYNDDGYLTDNQINCRNKLESGAREKFYQIVSQNQSNKPVKSMSQTNFKYLNKLKAEVDKQFGRQTMTYEVNRLPSKTRQNIDKSKQQKSEYPSQLPPSSSLYKNKFKVQYIPQVFNENILKKNQINDSFHERQEKKMKEHQNAVFKSAKSSLIKKNKQKKSQISQHKQQKMSLGQQRQQKMSYEDSQQSHQSFLSQSKDQSQKQIKVDKINGISKIGGIFSDPNSHVNQTYKAKNQLQQSNFLQQISKYSKSNKSNDKIKQKLLQNFDQPLSTHSKPSINSSSLKQKKQIQKQNKIVNDFQINQKPQDNAENIQDLDMINSKYKKFTIRSSNQIQKQSPSSISQKQSLSSMNQKQKAFSKSQKQPQSSILQKQAQSSMSQKQAQSSIQQKQTQLIKIQSKINQLNKVKFPSSLQNINKQQCNKEFSLQNQLKQKQKQLSKRRQEIQNQYELTNSIKKKTKQQNSNQSKVNPFNKKKQTSSIIKNQNNDQSYFQITKREKQVTKNMTNNQMSNMVLINSKKKTIIDSNSQLPIESDMNLPIGSRKGLNFSKNKQKDKLSQIENSQNQFLKEQIQPTMFGKNETRRIEDKTTKMNLNQSLKKEINKHASITQNNKQNKQSKIIKAQFLKQKSKLSRLMHNSSKSLRSNYSDSLKSSHSHSLKSQFSHSKDYCSFNFLQKIHNLIDIQQDKHQNRKNKQQQSLLSSQFQEVLTKIQFHIYLVRFILDVAASAYHIYPQKESAWVYKSCFLSFKKYILQRKKISQALKGNKSCFKIAEYQITQDDLKPYIENLHIKTLAIDIDACNKLTQQILEDYALFLKSNYPQELDQTDINLRSFNDRNDLGILFRQYNLQIQGLRDKNNEESIDQQQNQIINQRIMHLMQTAFLCSELAGKRIKQFQQELQEQQDFEQYFQQFWPLFQHILQTFS